MRIAAGDVVADLEREGYDVAVFDFEAAAVGAPHRRERIAFVANSKRSERRQSESGGNVTDRDYTKREKTASWSGTSSEDGRARIVADTEGSGLQRMWPSRERKRGTHEEEGTTCGYCDVPDAEGTERDGREQRAEQTGWGGFTDRRAIRVRGQWSVEPDMGRVAHGVPHRVDRIICLGNAVVHQQFYPIFKAIYEVET
jgi:DNA (cytosine-5)-methyltransferase 1